MMDDKELERMGLNLDIDDQDEQQSVITQDRLKQFNEIYGYEDGPAVQAENNNQEDFDNEE